jgi:hypothetical protein
MDNISLQDQNIERHFAEMARLFIDVMDEGSSEKDLQEEYTRERDIILHLKAAEDPSGKMLGFTWVTRSRLTPAKSLPLSDCAARFQAASVSAACFSGMRKRRPRAAGIHTLEAPVLDDYLDGLAFARRQWASRKNTISLGCAWT